MILFKLKKNYRFLLIYILLLFPIPFYFYFGLINQLGPDPVKFLELKYGEMALIFIIVTLSITPIFKIFNINLLKYRRCLGLVSFYYVLAHISIYLIFDIGFSWDLFISDLKKRYFIIAGFLAFLFLVPLAITSSDKAIKKLSIKTWKKLHKLVFIVLTFSLIHFILLSKTWTIELLTYTFVAIILLAARIKYRKYISRFLNILKS